MWDCTSGFVKDASGRPGCGFEGKFASLTASAPKGGNLVTFPNALHPLANRTKIGAPPSPTQTKPGSGHSILRGFHINRSLSRTPIVPGPSAGFAERLQSIDYPESKIDSTKRVATLIATEHKKDSPRFRRGESENNRRVVYFEVGQLAETIFTFCTVNVGWALAEEDPPEGSAPAFFSEPEIRSIWPTCSPSFAVSPAS